MTGKDLLTEGFVCSLVFPVTISVEPGVWRLNLSIFHISFGGEKLPQKNSGGQKATRKVKNSGQIRILCKGKIMEETRSQKVRVSARNLASPGVKFRKEFGHEKKRVLWAKGLTMEYSLKLQFRLHLFFLLGQQLPKVLDGRIEQRFLPHRRPFQ